MKSLVVLEKYLHKRPSAHARGGVVWEMALVHARGGVDWEMALVLRFPVWSVLREEFCIRLGLIHSIPFCFFFVFRDSWPWKTPERSSKYSPT